jgi:hypothetical protein
METGPMKRFRVLRQEEAVGGHAEIVDPREGGQLSGQKFDAAADKGLPPGQTDLADSEAQGDPRKADQLFITKDLIVWDGPDPLLGHTVSAAQIAPVGNGDT